MTALLELNDAALSLYQGESLVYGEPAAAYLDDQATTYGHAALRQARLHPQRANQQYLNRMSSDPLPYANRVCANHADLVYGQLGELARHADQPVAIAVPGVMTPDQLGVLLGIAEEAGLDVRGFVDSGVLLANGAEVSGHCHVLDLHLERACLTRLSISDGISRESAQELDCGIARLVDGWVNLIADQFVQQTRFDPLHSAQSEQQLYDQVYAWMQGHSGEFEVAVALSDHERNVTITSNALDDKLRQRLQPVAAQLEGNGQLLLSPRSARIPGLTRALTALGLDAHPLPADVLQRNFATHEQAIAGGADPRLITRLEFTGSHQAEVAAAPKATHVLIDSRAYPLSTNPLGLPAEGAPGDRGVRDGQAYELIVVEG